MSSRRHYLLYDGECRYCRAFKRLVVFLDPRQVIAPVELASDEGAALLDGMSEHARYSSFHLVCPGREVRSGGDALPMLLSLISGSRGVSWFVERPSVRWLLALGYSSLSRFVSITRCGANHR